MKERRKVEMWEKRERESVIRGMNELIGSNSYYEDDVVSEGERESESRYFIVVRTRGGNGGKYALRAKEGKGRRPEGVKDLVEERTRVCENEGRDPDARGGRSCYGWRILAMKRLTFVA